MGKLPAIMFYTGDWLKDPALSKCSPATRGIWMDLLCSMHESTNRGKVSGTANELSRSARCSAVEMSSALEEIQKTRCGNISEREGVFTVINRRMVREYKEKDMNAIRQGRYREKGGGDPDRWTAIRVKILERDEYKCGYCGRKARTVDHIKPRCQGGDEADLNLVACCYKCNTSKNGRTPEEAGLRHPIWKSNGDSNGKNNGSYSYSSSISPSGTEVQTHNPREALPRLEEVKTEAQLRGFPPDEAERFWNHFESMGWKDRNSNDVVKWRPKLAMWCADARGKAHEPQSPASPRRKAPTVWEMKQSLEIIEDKLKVIRQRGHEGPLGMVLRDADKPEYKVLMTERSRLRDGIAKGG